MNRTMKQNRLIATALVVLCLCTGAIADLSPEKETLLKMVIAGVERNNSLLPPLKVTMRSTHTNRRALKIEIPNADTINIPAGTTISRAQYYIDGSKLRKNVLDDQGIVTSTCSNGTGPWVDYVPKSKFAVIKPSGEWPDTPEMDPRQIGFDSSFDRRNFFPENLRHWEVRDATLVADPNEGPVVIIDGLYRGLSFIIRCPEKYNFCARSFELTGTKARNTHMYQYQAIDDSGNIFFLSSASTVQYDLTRASPENIIDSTEYVVESLEISESFPDKVYQIDLPKDTKVRDLIRASTISSRDLRSQGSNDISPGYRRSQVGLIASASTVMLTGALLAFRKWQRVVSRE